MKTFQKISFYSTFLVGCLLPFGIWAAIQLPIGSAGVHEWLPEGRQERRLYNEFVDAFGNDQIVLASWDGCSVNDLRLPAFRQLVEAQAHTPSPLIASVESTDLVLQSLTQPPLRLKPEVASQRLQGFLIGEDGTAAVLIRATDLGVASQAETIETIYQAADQIPGLGRKSLHIAGTIFESFAVDHYAEASLVTIVPISSCLGLAIAWICLKRLRYAIAVLILAAVGQLMAVALVYYSGAKFSAVLIVLPTLVFMLTLSGAVHLMNYYRDSCEGDPQSASTRAVGLGWKPCLLSSLTTIFGMGSLLTSQLAPIREFGVFSAVALSLATLILLVTFPTIISWLDRRIRRATTHSKGFVAKSGSSTKSEAPTTLNSYIRFLSNYATTLSVASILLLFVSFWGLSKLKASTKFTEMFDRQSQVNQDMYWLEEHLGPIATIEVLLRVPSDSSLSNFERVQWVSRIADGLREYEDVGAVLSVASFLPSWSDGSSIGAVSRRSAVRKAVDENVEQFRNQKWFADSDNGRLWRIVTKVSATNQKSYGQISSAILACGQQLIEQHGGADEIEIFCTGLCPLISQTQVTLLQDLGSSFLTAFLLITPMMVWITRSLRGGLLSMIPNVIPVTVVFGTMGGLGYSLDIAGILTASIALGIAVDDTLHFLCWYMGQRREDRSRLHAVQSTFHACAKAMFHTTLISCLSMAPFMFAGFLPTQQFAKLMIAMLIGAIIGDLLILPALLLSPLGVVFRYRIARFD